MPEIDHPYVVALGKPETASSRLDLTQAFNSLGTTIAPPIGGFLILSHRSPPYVSFYWGGAMVGRFLGIVILRKIKPAYALAICATCAAGLVGISMLSSGQLAMGSILAVGLFNSIMFPTIFSLGVAELGPLTSRGSGLLNMAIVGGAILPLLQGLIADRVGIHLAFCIPVLCYSYIVYYAVRGSKPNSHRVLAA